MLQKKISSTKSQSASVSMVTRFPQKEGLYERKEMPWHVLVNVI
jgi:hypothetical protein